MKAQPSYPKIIIHRLGGPIKTPPQPRLFPMVPTVLISALLTLSALGFFPAP